MVHKISQRNKKEEKNYQRTNPSWYAFIQWNDLLEDEKIERKEIDVSITGEENVPTFHVALPSKGLTLAHIVMRIRLKCCTVISNFQQTWLR